MGILLGLDKLLCFYEIVVKPYNKIIKEIQMVLKMLFNDHNNIHI